MGYIDPAWEEETLSRARSYVEGIVERVRTAGIVVDGEARQAPNLADTILAMADEVESDLIVMSTQALAVRREHCWAASPMLLYAVHIVRCCWSIAIQPRRSLGPLRRERLAGRHRRWQQLPGDLPAGVGA